MNFVVKRYIAMPRLGAGWAATLDARGHVARAVPLPPECGHLVGRIREGVGVPCWEYQVWWGEKPPGHKDGLWEARLLAEGTADSFPAAQGACQAELARVEASFRLGWRP